MHIGNDNILPKLKYSRYAKKSKWLYVVSFIWNEVEMEEILNQQENKAEIIETAQFSLTQ